MLTAIPIIDVETTFADFVEKYGGVVSDRLSSSPNKPRNADYISHDEKVIAELKLLKENPLQNKDFLKSRAKKTREWLQKGYITDAQLNAVTKISQLPDKCYRDIIKLYMRPVKYAVEQANKQIKATKQTMNLPDYKGLVFLTSDGNYFIEPPNVARMAAMILDNPNQYRSINMIVYLTVNVVTTRPDDETLSRLWVRLYRENQRFEPIALAFLQDLFNKWVDYYKEVSGVDLDAINEINENGLTETDVLSDTRFVRPLRLNKARASASGLRFRDFQMQKIFYSWQSDLRTKQIAGSSVLRWRSP